VLVAIQISHQRGCDPFIAVAAVVLEDRGERKGYVAPAFIGLALPSGIILRQETGLFEIEIEISQIASMRDNRLSLGAEANGQISNALAIPLMGPELKNCSQHAYSVPE